MSTARSTPAQSTSELWRQRTKKLAEQRRNLSPLFGAKETAQCLTEAGARFDPPLAEVNVANLQFITDLPLPVTGHEIPEVAATRLWLADEIRAFAEIYAERRRGRRGARANGSSPPRRKRS